MEIKTFKLNTEELKLALNNGSSALWTGIDAPGFYSKTFFESTAIKDFTKILDAKDKVKLAKLDADSIIQDDSDSFSATDLTLNQKQVTVAGKKVNLELPIRSLEQSFISTSLMPGSNSMATTGDFINYVVDFSAKLAAQDIEKLTWSTGSTQNGLIYQAKNDTGTTIVTSTTVTSSNVIAEMTKIYNAIPASILHKPDLVIYVSSSIYKAYRVAFSTAALSSGVYNGDLAELSFMGVKVKEAQGMGTNNAFAACLSNLYFVTDLVEDYKNLMVIDYFQTSGNPVIRVVSRFKFAVSYVIPQEVVVYG